MAGVQLGVLTDTYDMEGKVVDTCEVPDHLDISSTLSNFPRHYLQEVPIYSAVKVNGKKLYEYARRKEEVLLPKKEVSIFDMELLESHLDTFSFRASVSKGCYIRSLIHDIGEKLGVYATMSSLVRTRQGEVGIEDCFSLEEIFMDTFKIYSMEDVFKGDKIVVNSSLEKKIQNGVMVPNLWNVSDKVMFLNEQHKILGIYEVFGENLKTWKNFSF